MSNNIHYYNELRDVDITNVYSYGSYAHEFGETRLSAGNNIRRAALSGILFFQFDFPATESCTCCGDKVCIPYGNVNESITYRFIGVKDGIEYTLLDETHDRVFTGPCGRNYISTNIGRISTDENNDIVYDEIYATISIGESDNCGRKRKKKNKVPMNGEIVVYGKR